MATNNAFNNQIATANSDITLNAGTNTISIGSDSSNSTVNVGTGAGVKTCNFGSSNTTSPTVIRSGTGNIVMNTGLTVDSTGRNYNAVQPAFLAYLTSTQNDKTGTGTSYYLGTNALTEIFDQGSNFNTNGTFTAPIAGKYYFGAQATLVGCTIASAMGLSIETSNRNYINSSTRAASNQNFNMQVNNLCDMDAGDTFVCSISATGESGNTDDVFGNASHVFTAMYGNLVC